MIAKDSIVKFTHPTMDAEECDRMLVIEDRGDRVLVISLVYNTNWNPRPTFVHAKSELSEIDSEHP